MKPFDPTTGSRFRAPWVALTLLTLMVALPGEAAVRSFAYSGAVTSSSFSGIPNGTSFSGTYQVDDATADSNGDAALGDYATGRFTVLLQGIGDVVLDQGPDTRVRNDVVVFNPVVADTFRILAGEGSRNLPFTNPITFAEIFFSNSGVGAQPPLSDDSLTGALAPSLGDWGDGGEIHLTLSAAGTGTCPPLATTCPAVLTLSSLGEAFELTVTKDGTGTGVVESSPPGIDCGATCAADFAGMVTLTATPDAGSTLSAWSGCDNEAGTLCDVDVASARAVTATFDQAEEELAPIPTLDGAALLALTTLLAIAGAWTLHGPGRL